MVATVTDDYFYMMGNKTARNAITGWTYFLLAAAFLLFEQRSNGQTINQSDSLKSEKMIKAKVVGVYTCCRHHHGSCKIKIKRGHHFKEYTYGRNTKIVEKGSWIIKNDTLFLTYNKKKIFLHKKRVNSNDISGIKKEYVFRSGNLCDISVNYETAFILNCYSKKKK